MIRVIVADDHPLVRRGLKDIAAKHPDIQVEGEASTGTELLTVARRTPCDVFVMDITMPGLSGLDLLRQLKIEFPDVPVLVLSMHPEDQFAVRFLRAGASGYITKDRALEELVKAIRKLARGQRYISEDLAQELLYYLDDDGDKALHERLSNREFQVLCLLGDGKPIKEIAEELSLSPKTVSTYRSRILTKMNMESNAELIAYAVRNGLVD
jgi:two-component system invasion response regulator UvrY